jgi:hypothetical protein
LESTAVLGRAKVRKYIILSSLYVYLNRFVLSILSNAFMKSTLNLQFIGP